MGCTKPTHDLPIPSALGPVGSIMPRSLDTSIYGNAPHLNIWWYSLTDSVYWAFIFSQRGMEQLRAMGIADEDASQQALIAASGNVEAAVNILFASGLNDLWTWSGSPFLPSFTVLYSVHAAAINGLRIGIAGQVEWRS